MSEAFRQRVRIRFSKAGDARFLSHHDLMRAWEMALRRSALPVRMSEGFNPRVKLSMPMALGLGIASRDEVVEIELDGWTPADEVRGRLAPELPPGIILNDLQLVPAGQRGQVAWVEYLLRVAPETGRRLEALMDAAEVPVERIREESRQRIDIRPHLLEIAPAPDGWRVRIRVTPQGTARPDEVLRAVGMEGPQVAGLIEKTRTELEVPPPPRGLSGRRA